MQDKHGFLELDGIDSAISAADAIFGHFQDAGSTESFHDLGCIVSVTTLREVKRMTKKNFRTPIGKAIKSILLPPIQTSGFSCGIAILGDYT
jgi:hypothetical protein